MRLAQWIVIGSATVIVYAVVSKTDWIPRLINQFKQPIQQAPQPQPPPAAAPPPAAPAPTPAPPAAPSPPPSTAQIPTIITPEIPETVPGRGPTRGPTSTPFRVYRGNNADSNGCYNVKYHSGGSGISCRRTADLSYIGDKSYRIDATVDIGPMKVAKDQEFSITSGGPGSTGKNCCGFTVRVNLNDGTLQLESEDWSQGGTTGATYCKGASCVPSGQPSSISGGKPLYNTNGVKLAWVVIRDGGGHATYHAEATGPAGTVISKSFTDPPAHKGNTGPAVIPFKVISGSRVANGDGDRVRLDSAANVTFHDPVVTILETSSTVSPTQPSIPQQTPGRGPTKSTPEPTTKKKSSSSSNKKKGWMEWGFDGPRYDYFPMFDPDMGYYESIG